MVGLGTQLCNSILSAGFWLAIMEGTPKVIEGGVLQTTQVRDRACLAIIANGGAFFAVSREAVFRLV
jgi:hypothetical protein